MGNSSLKEKFDTISPFESRGCGNVNGDNQLWHLYDGKLKDSKEDVSVFVYNTEKAMKIKGNSAWDPWNSALRTLNLMRSYRHPFLLTYVDSLVLEKKQEMYIVTEPVWPLLHVIKSMGSVELIVVLADCMRGLTFMHEHGLPHNNLSFDCLFVTRSKHLRCVVGGWEYGGQPYDVATRTVLITTRSLRCEAAITPEENTGENVDYGLLPVHVRDVYAFAKIVRALVVEDTPTMSAKRKTAKRPQTFRPECAVPAVYSSLMKWTEKAMHPTPAERVKITFYDLIALPIFNRSTFLKLNLAFDELLLLPRKAKDELLKQMHWEVMKVPFEVFLFRLLPRILSFPFLCDIQCEEFLPYLLTPMTDINGPVGLLPMSLYKELVVSFVVRCITSKRRDAFYIILRHMEEWLPHIPPEIIYADLYPTIFDGLEDMCDDIAHAAVESLCAMVRFITSKKECVNHVRFETEFLVHVNTVLLPQLQVMAYGDPCVYVRLSATLTILEMSYLHSQIRNDLLVEVITRSLSNNPDALENVPIFLHVLRAVDRMIVHFTPTCTLLNILPSIHPLLLSSSEEVRTAAHEVATKMFTVPWPANYTPKYERLKVFPPECPVYPPLVQKPRVGKMFTGKVVDHTAPDDTATTTTTSGAGNGGASPPGTTPTYSYDFTDDYDEEWNIPGVLSADHFPAHIAQDWDLRHAAIHPLAVLLPTRSIYSQADSSSSSSSNNNNSDVLAAAWNNAKGNGVRRRKGSTFSESTIQGPGQAYTTPEKGYRKASLGGGSGSVSPAIGSTGGKKEGGKKSSSGRSSGKKTVVQLQEE